MMLRAVKSMIFSEILPLYHSTGSQTFPLHFATRRCDSLLHSAVASQILPLQNAEGNRILPLHDAAGLQILLPHNAVESEILPLYHAVGSQLAAGSQFCSRESIWQRGVKSKILRLRRLPRPLKGQ
jgi:hypothetical protein